MSTWSLSHVIHEHMVLNIVFCKMSFSHEEITDLPDKPFQQQHYFFPPRSFGKAQPENCFFQASWFHHFSWIHYDATDDYAFCFLCCKAVKGKKMRLTRLSEASFLVKGFTNWMDATQVLGKHESSNFHKAATEALKATNDVSDMLSKAAATEKNSNHEYLLKINSSIRFLGRQGLHLRGDGSHNDLDSNFYQLLLLRAEDFQGINVFMEKKPDEIHFSLLSIMSLQVIREIASQIQSSLYFTMMIDEARILLILSKLYWLFILSMTISLLLKISLVYIKLNLVLSKMSYFG